MSIDGQKPENWAKTLFFEEGSELGVLPAGGSGLRPLKFSLFLLAWGCKGDAGRLEKHGRKVSSGYHHDRGGVMTMLRALYWICKDV